MKVASRLLLGLLAIGLGIQLVPYGHDRSNPPVANEPAWSDARTRELFFQACGDCHSNETVWPWYSAVAPVSWLVRMDVDEGREHFNVSEWGREHNEGDEAARMVRKGRMPLWYYLPLHPEAELSDAERDTLIAGLVATFGDEDATDPGGEHEHDSDGH